MTTANIAAIPPGTALDDNFARFVLAITGLRPRPLNVLNSPGALYDRAELLEKTIMACSEYLTFLVEDTAGHVALSRRLDDIVTDYMSDLAGDLRGYLLVAIPDTKVAPQ